MSLTREEKMDRAGTESGSWRSLFRNIVPTATSLLPTAASLVYPTATKVVTSALTSSKKREPGESRKTDEEQMDLAGTEKISRRLPRFLFRTSSMGKAQVGVIGIQRALASIGIPVKPTGKIDRATVEGVNNVLRGWDDAPPSLKKGELTSAGIARNLPAVSKAIKLALRGAKDFGDASHSDE